jgi:hypothetical protein
MKKGCEVSSLAAIDRYEQNGESDPRHILVRGFVHLFSGERQHGAKQIEKYLYIVSKFTNGNFNTNITYALRLKRILQLPPHVYDVRGVLLQKMNWRLMEQAG